MNLPIKKLVIFGSAFLFLLMVGGTWLGVSYLRQFVGPAFLPPKEDITEVINTTGMPLKFPPGFSISIFAKNLPGARVMAIDPFGNMWVSQTKEGKISLLEIKDGMVVNQNEVFTDLRKPHGLTFDPQNPFMLYFAEEDKISRVPTYSEGPPGKIIDLPTGGRHFTRTIGFGPDNRLYVSIGSSCDVCIEEDGRRAKIFSLNRDGTDFKEYARGLRNAVFFTWDYVHGRMWGTEMGRDFLGDDLPPDEINIIEAGKNYGWPVCYGKNIHDTKFDPAPEQVRYGASKNTSCDGLEASHIDISAHSAPLGLAFIPEDPPSLEASDGQGGWPKEYWYNLLVAYHGSWNRSKPTGYKVVRYKLDAKGSYLGEEDFISGWLQGGEALGRPVDILVEPNGVIYISDDKAGVIYKVTYRPPRS